MEKRTASEAGHIMRIAITGPESTGKSMLSVALADHYQTSVVREAARKFISRLHRPYTYEDLVQIAKIQIETEKRNMKKANKYLFCDTELTVIKIWALHKFGKCPHWVERKLNEIHYDLYLLCDIDLPWEADPQREHPDKRKYFFNKFYDELSARKIPFVVISGSGDHRTQHAIDAIEALN